MRNNQLSEKQLLKKFRKKYAVDFRQDCYIRNTHGLSPVMDYDFAKIVIKGLYNFLEEEFNDRLIIYNLENSVAKLESIKLKEFIESTIEKYVSQYNLRNS